MHVQSLRPPKGNFLRKKYVIPQHIHYRSLSSVRPFFLSNLSFYLISQKFSALQYFSVRQIPLKVPLFMLSANMLYASVNCLNSLACTHVNDVDPRSSFPVVSNDPGLLINVTVYATQLYRTVKLDPAMKQNIVGHVSHCVNQQMLQVAHAGSMHHQLIN